MENLQVMFDSLVGYLVGMAIVEVVVKPLVVRVGKKTLQKIDESSPAASVVIPDWLFEELPSEREYDV